MNLVLTQRDIFHRGTKSPARRKSLWFGLKFTLQDGNVIFWSTLLRRVAFCKSQTWNWNPPRPFHELVLWMKSHMSHQRHESKQNQDNTATSESESEDTFGEFLFISGMRGALYVLQESEDYHNVDEGKIHPETNCWIFCWAGFQIYFCLT